MYGELIPKGGGDAIPLLKEELLVGRRESCDIVLVLGCKFSHNGAHGFRLKIPADRLVHVDASPDVPGSNYEASEILIGDAPGVIRALLESADRGRSISLPEFGRAARPEPGQEIRRPPASRPTLVHVESPSAG